MKITGANFDDLLLDYVYGELPEDARAAFEAYVAEHAEAREALADIQGTRAALSPLRADFEPPQITTNRVLVHAREAAEDMALSGRLWGLFPRYAPAMAAVLAVAVGIVVVAPRDTEHAAEFELAKVETLAEEAARPPLPGKPALASAYETAEADDTDVGLRRNAPTAVGGTVDSSLAKAQSQWRTSSVASHTEGAAVSAEAKTPDAKRDMPQESGGYAGAPLDAVEERKTALAKVERSRQRDEFFVNALAYQGVVAANARGDLRETEKTYAASPPARVGQDAAGATDTQHLKQRGFADMDGEDAAVGRLAGFGKGEEANERLGEPRTEIVDETAPPSRIAALFAELEAGRARQLSGAHAAAIHHFQNVVVNAPAAPVAVEAQFETARSLVALNQCDRALTALQDVLDNAPAFPRRPEVLLAQARCYTEIGEYDAALARFDMFEFENPTQRDRVRSDRMLLERKIEGVFKKARAADISDGVTAK